MIGLIGRRSSDRAIDYIGGEAELKRTPKYLNMPDTITYRKSEALYRPSNVELDPKGQVVAVEGTLDALAVAAAAAQRGMSRFYAPVAASGAALSTRPARTHRRRCPSGHPCSPPTPTTPELERT